MCSAGNIVMLLLLLPSPAMSCLTTARARQVNDYMKILHTKISGVHMSLRRFSCLLALAVLLASPAWAQFTSNVQGAVQDSSGAVVPKATVTLVNAGTQVTRTTTADADGN